ncbi:hypothetical protein BH23GEM9_BH23GEM9_10730 [soil metagenome]
MASGRPPRWSWTAATVGLALSLELPLVGFVGRPDSGRAATWTA